MNFARVHQGYSAQLRGNHFGDIRKDTVRKMESRHAQVGLANEVQDFSPEEGCDRLGEAC
jgi:hypothetical protein